jgi:hypothetical protein
MFDFATIGDAAPTIQPLIADGAINRPLDQLLAWQVAWNPMVGGQASVPYHDVYFGLTNPPLTRVVYGYPGGGSPLTVIAGDSPNPGHIYRYAPGALQINTTYYWAVIVSNMFGWMRASPVYAFTTGSTLAPGVPSSPTPADAGLGGLNPTLTWSSTGATTYDVFFGTANPPPLVSTGQAAASYQPAGPLTATTVYRWKIVAHNAGGATTGAVWSFTARVYAIAAAPTVTLAAGSGLGAGVYKYAYTDVTASGESLPSPLATITTGAPAAPAGTPTATQLSAAFAAGTDWAIGDSIYYAVTYVTTYGETAPGTATNTVTANASNTPGHPVMINVESLPVPSDPAVTKKRIYRNRNASWSGYFETGMNDGQGQTLFNASTNFFDAGLGNWIAGSPPGSALVVQQVAISAVAVGIAPTTQRKIYRTAVGGAQLKLQQTIANNTATTGVQDATADGSLGANVPTSDTSGL